MLSRTIAFLLGILALQQVAVLPGWPWLVALLLLFAFFLSRTSRYSVLGLLAAACFGFLWAGLHAHLIIQPGLEPHLEGEELLLSGVIVSLPQEEERRLRFVFAPEAGWLAERAVTVPKRLRLSWYNDYPKGLMPGQHWQLLVKLKRPWGMMNPGGFDYEAWLFSRGIRATGYVRASPQNRMLGENPWVAPLQYFRAGLHQRLMHSLGEHPARGIITALALGERGAITDSQWEVLLASGTNHLVAISGLHVGLVAGLVFFLANLLWRRCPRCCLHLAAPKAAALVALCAGVFYAALAGFSIPTQRAMLMLALVLGAVLWQRPVVPWRTLLLAFWLVLLWQPMAVLEAGFWLSFAAVALILFGMGGRLGSGGLWWKWGRVQWLVAIGLMPLLLLFFQQGSLSAPLANLIAVPLVGFLVVPLTLLGTSLLLIWEPVGGALLQAAAAIVQWAWPVLEGLNQYVPMISRSAPAWTLVPGMVGIVWLLMPRGWPLRRLGAVWLLPVLLVRPEPPASGTAEFTLLDVGQGLAAVVQTRQHALVFDTGPRFPSGFDTGEAVLLPFLRERGIDRLDLLIVSHGDNDHIGGARALTEGLPVSRLLTSVPRKIPWADTESCRAGESWVWDGVHFAMLHPPERAGPGRGNDDSCVLRVTAGDQSVLLTGDIEAPAEQELLGSGADLSAQVLVAPHHGSKTSSTEAFIAAVGPQWVFYPVGYRNRYGFPRPHISQRYRQAGVQELASYRTGALSVTLGRGRLEPQAWREIARRYWHSR